MYVHTQPVAGAVHVKPVVGIFLDERGGAALEQPQLHQATGDDLDGRVVRRVPGVARVDFLYGRQLRIQHQLVNGLLRLAEATVHRETAGNIGSIVFMFRTGIDKQNIAVVQRCVVFCVMQDAGVLAAADDGGIGGLTARLAKLVQELRLQFVFHHARLADVHGALVRTGSDIRGLAHDLDFGAAFVQTHIVYKMFQRNKLVRCMFAGARLAANAIDPANQLLVELGRRTHGVKYPLTAFQQAGQNLIDILDGKRVIGAEVLHRALGSGTPAVPGFHFRVAITTKQQVLAVFAARRKHHHGFGFRKPGEIVKITVRPEREIHVAVTRLLRVGRQDSDSVRPHHAHQLFTPAGKFFLIHHPDFRLLYLCWRAGGLQFIVQVEYTHADVFNHLLKRGELVLTGLVGFKIHPGNL